MLWTIAKAIKNRDFNSKNSIWLNAYCEIKVIDIRAGRSRFHEPAARFQRRKTVISLKRLSRIDPCSK